MKETKQFFMVRVSACPFCGTAEHDTEVPRPVAAGWHECTSGNGIHGGGACCAPLDHSASKEVQA